MNTAVDLPGLKGESIWGFEAFVAATVLMFPLQRQSNGKQLLSGSEMFVVVILGIPPRNRRGFLLEAARGFHYAQEVSFGFPVP